MAPPLQYSCLENPVDRGAWKAAVHGVAEGRTRLSDFTFTFHFHALEKEMATHSSVLAWRIPGTGEPGGLPSIGSHRVGHDWSNLAAAAAAKYRAHSRLQVKAGCLLLCSFFFSMDLFKHPQKASVSLYEHFILCAVKKCPPNRFCGDQNFSSDSHCVWKMEGHQSLHKNRESQHCITHIMKWLSQC